MRLHQSYPQHDTWTSDQDALLMDAMAEGASFSKAAQFVGVSKDQAKHRFNRLAARLGADVDLTASRGAAQ